MKKNYYFTRKNFIALAIALFYSICILVSGACIEGSHTIVGSRNVINKIATVLKVPAIEASIAGYVGLLLLACYVSVFAASVIYIRRYAIENHMKTYALKPMLSYIGVFLGCGAFSVGVTILLISPKTAENIGITMQFLGYALMIGTLIFLALAVVVLAVAMLVINLIFIDKPFRFFGKNDLDVVEEEEDYEHIDVTSSFDQDPYDAGYGAGGYGAGGGYGAPAAAGEGAAASSATGGSASSAGASSGAAGGFGGGAAAGSNGTDGASEGWVNATASAAQASGGNGGKGADATPPTPAADYGAGGDGGNGGGGGGARGVANVYKNTYYAPNASLIVSGTDTWGNPTGLNGGEGGAGSDGGDGAPGCVLVYYHVPWTVNYNLYLLADGAELITADGLTFIVKRSD